MDQIHTETLAGKCIAILATDGFEQSELIEPRKALLAAGAEVQIIALRPGQIQGMIHSDKGDKVTVDGIIGDVSETQFSGLVLPGGVSNPDELRTNSEAVSFVRAFFNARKPVAAICHGPWTLIEADVVRGRSMTSWPSLKTDLTNAGAVWSDTDVIVDKGLVTSRNPADLPVFCAEVVKVFSKAEGDIDLDAALADPGLAFSDPKEVLALKNVDDAQKLKILAQWERDARGLAVAEEEGMGGGEESQLHHVLDAIHDINQSPEDGTGTKTPKAVLNLAETTQEDVMSIDQIDVSKTLISDADRTETHNLIASNKVEGTPVYNMRKDHLGKIQNFMVNKISGHVDYAVMSFGGFLGMGDSYYPIPWKKLQYDTTLRGYVVDIDPAQLNNAPSYVADGSAEWVSSDYGRRIDEYYGFGPLI